MSKATKYIGKNGRRYSSMEKFELVLKNIIGAATVTEIKKEVGVEPKTLTSWKKQFFNKGHAIFEQEKAKKGRQSKEEKTIERQEKEIQLLKKLLKHYKKIQQNQSSESEEGS